MSILRTERYVVRAMCGLHLKDCKRVEDLMQLLESVSCTEFVTV